MNKYIVESSGGDKYGPFDTVEEAKKWMEDYEEIVGDAFVEEICSPEIYA